MRGSTFFDFPRSPNPFTPSVLQYCPVSQTLLRYSYPLCQPLPRFHFSSSFHSNPSAIPRSSFRELPSTNDVVQRAVVSHSVCARRHLALPVRVVVFSSVHTRRRRLSLSARRGVSLSLRRRHSLSLLRGLSLSLRRRQAMPKIKRFRNRQKSAPQPQCATHPPTHSQEHSSPMPIPSESSPSLEVPSHATLNNSPPVDSSSTPENPLDSQTSRQCTGRQSTQYWTVETIDSEETTKKLKIKAREINELPRGERVIVHFDEQDAAYGEAQGLLAGYCGTLAIDCKLFPINFDRWSGPTGMPDSYFERCFAIDIKPKFSFRTTEALAKRYCKMSIGKKWSASRQKIWSEFYDQFKTRDQIISNVPTGIDKDQWALFVNYRLKPQTLELCKKNKEIRSMQVIPHTGGSKPNARRRYEMFLETGQLPSRGKLYIETHKRKDGSFVNDTAKEIAEKIGEGLTQSTNDESIASPNDIVGRVLGPEHSGRVRCMGMGAAPTNAFRNTRLRLSNLSVSSANGASPSSSNPWQERSNKLEGAFKAYMIMKEGKIPEELAGFFDPPLCEVYTFDSNQRERRKFMASKESPPFNSEILGKAKWDSISTKMFLDICMEEICRSGKLGIAFRNKKWEEIREEFHRRANKNYTQKQLKNRLDNLRVDWTTWKQLMGKETGLGYNHQTGTIEADAAWWDAKIRENAKYAKFRYQGLEFCDELEFIFGETVATSQTMWTPSIGVATESNGKNKPLDVPHEIIESDDDFNNDDELSPVENTQSRKKRNASQDMSEKPTKGKGKVGTAASMRKSFERLVQAAESHNEAEKNEIAVASHFHGEYSIPDCVKVLKSAKEERFLNGRQFSFALEMLRDDQTRVLLMSLKDSMDALVEWILYKYESQGNL